jgi:hypothetical protein
MPILVHLTSHKNVSKIMRSGIIGVKRNVYCEFEGQQLNKELKKAVYCMPILQNYYISHQWLRELKRGGQKNFVGIYFRIESEQLVWVGRYNQPHIQLTVNEAIAIIMNTPKPQGYEIIIPRAINSSEIHKVKHLPQVLGWRYCPKAHSNKPTCACPMCIPIGSIKSNKLRERLEPPEKSQNYAELIAALKEAIASDWIRKILFNIDSTVRGGNRKNANDLEFLLAHPNVEIIEALASTLGAYKGKNAINMLLKLCSHECDNIRKASATSLLDILQQDAIV